MTQTVSFDPDLARLVDAFFRKRCTHELITRAESNGLPTGLWAETRELGLATVGVAEENGGAGGSVLDIVTVLRAAGRHAAPLPLVEHHVAALLLAAAGLLVPADPVTVALDPRDELIIEGSTVSGTLTDVAWLPGADQVVKVVEASDGPRLVVLAREGLALETSADLAGLPNSTVRLDRTPATIVPSGLSCGDAELRAMLGRAALLSGAIERTLALTRQYVGERVQFGKPIGSFQAVQQHIVTLAQADAMAGMAVDRAALAAVRGDAEFEITAAKLVASVNASASARAAHQAHGAMGLTREYGLQHLTRRLLTWRSESGADRPLALALGARAVAAPSLHHLIATEGAPRA